MKKVAIITLYGDFNFGNKLQNYAVQKIVGKLNYDCYTVCCKDTLTTVGWKGRIIAFLGFPKHMAKIKRDMLKRNQMFRRFSDKYLKLGETAGYNDAGKIRDKYDFYITGSDQVWNCSSKKQIDYFFLEFVAPHKRICLSPSFGLDNIKKELIQKYTDSLNGFRHLSCREESGCRIIKELTGREAQLLCDPTMAVTREEWDEIAMKPQVELPERYILTYFLGDAPAEAIRYAENLASERGIPVINLYNRDYPEYADIQPDEFLYLVKHSDHFCTTSFHGCVFSIIYHKNFTVFERKDLGGMHGRIETLLKKFGLESCDGAKELSDSICDFSSVDEILLAERNKLYDYLFSAFSDAETGESAD